MRIFWTKRALDEHDQAHAARFSDGVAHNAAIEAVHYYVAFRALGWWKEAIEQAEKDGNKYLTLAGLVAKIKEENMGWAGVCDGCKKVFEATSKASMDRQLAEHKCEKKLKGAKK